MSRSLREEHFFIAASQFFVLQLGTIVVLSELLEFFLAEMSFIIIIYLGRHLCNAHFITPYRHPVHI